MYRSKCTGATHAENEMCVTPLTSIFPSTRSMCWPESWIALPSTPSMRWMSASPAGAASCERPPLSRQIAPLGSSNLQCASNGLSMAGRVAGAAPSEIAQTITASTMRTVLPPDVRISYHIRPWSVPPRPRFRQVERAASAAIPPGGARRPGRDSARWSAPPRPRFRQVERRPGRDSARWSARPGRDSARWSAPPRPRFRQVERRPGRDSARWSAPPRPRFRTAGAARATVPRHRQ